MYWSSDRLINVWDQRFWVEVFYDAAFKFSILIDIKKSLNKYHVELIYLCFVQYLTLAAPKISRVNLVFISIFGASYKFCYDL